MMSSGHSFSYWVWYYMMQTVKEWVMFLCAQSSSGVCVCVCVFKGVSTEISKIMDTHTDLTLRLFCWNMVLSINRGHFSVQLLILKHQRHKSKMHCVVKMLDKLLPNIFTYHHQIIKIIKSHHFKMYMQYTLNKIINVTLLFLPPFFMSWTQISKTFSMYTKGLFLSNIVHKSV